MSADRVVRWEPDGGVAHVVMDRPGRLNALDEALGTQLLECLRDRAADPAVRCVVIRGEGRAFSAGADMDYLALELPDGAALTEGMRRIWNPIILAIRALEKPVVAAVHGTAAGFACGMAFACDVVLAADDAQFLLPFSRIGLTPDGAAIPIMSRVAGHVVMTRPMLTSEPIPAATAAEWRLVTELCPPTGLLDRADALAHRLATGPPLAFAATKELINASAFAGLAEQLDSEAVAQGRLLDTTDAQGAIDAFRQRTAPVFSGT